jgi:arylsulfatase
VSRPPIVLLIVVTAACAAPDTSPARSESTSRPNIIFALVDTLRADHTSLHGYHRVTTPFLESLGAESAVFERARSQAGCTYPSVNSFFTSRYTFDFYRLGPGDWGIPDGYPSMAELLHRHGYATAAVSASPIVRVTPSEHNPSAGFGRGFEIFDESCLWQRAECVNRVAHEILETLPEPYFLYLHYMDPHDPYRAPTSHRRFADEFDGHDFIAAGDPNPISEMLYDDGPNVEFDDGDIQHLIDLYDDEIVYFDEMFRHFIDGLHASGVLDRSLLMVTADHGEEFLEHGHVKHCRGVWNTLTHVPLLLRLPNGANAGRVTDPVQLVDLLPTVLEIAGAPADGVAMEGASLRPLIAGDGSRRDLAFSDQTEYRGIDDGRFHLIFNGLDRTVALYDISADPLELDDLSSSGGAELDRLASELDAWLDRTGQREFFDLALASARAQEEQLRALGYLE